VQVGNTSQPATKQSINMKKLMKQLLVIAALALGTVLTMSACNTVHGAGKDVKRAGQGIENVSGK
jgi:predicted small secreted protein